MTRCLRLMPLIAAVLAVGCYHRPAVIVTPGFGGGIGYSRTHVYVNGGGSRVDANGRTRGGFSTPNGTGSTTLSHQGGGFSGGGGGFSRGAGSSGSFRRSGGFSRR